ncbi:MAG TPA: cysteine protease StiP domain-containing protein [Propionibacteriaceae bacterium]|nr:cysteine protease StiP domain-containing protein [Propionibacteriaceae bacterium]
MNQPAEQGPELSMRRSTSRGDRFSSYLPAEVTFLVKDLSRSLVEVTQAEYEQRVNQGRHYAEMLPEEEYRPTAEALSLFKHALHRSARRLALAVGITTEKVLSCRGPDPVLVSLCQTGTPIGVLLRRWAAWRHGVALRHYTISVVRGHGVDDNALSYIVDRHDSAAVQFIDGWTGKCSIARELTATLQRRTRRHGAAPPDSLAVLVDPGDCAAIAGTTDDFLVPNACLNATVSGLVSRTVVTPDLVGPNDFHGAKYYPEMRRHDLSLRFLDTVSREFPAVAYEVDAHRAQVREDRSLPSFVGERHAQSLAADYGLRDVNLVKAGVSETVRMLLHRTAQRVIVQPEAGPDVEDVRQLAARRSVPVEERADLGYACVGLMQAATDGL